MSAANAGNQALCTTVQVEMRPRPLAGRHSMWSVKHHGHTGPGGRCGLPQSVQYGSTSLRARRPSQNGLLSGVILGKGFISAPEHYRVAPRSGPLQVARTGDLALARRAAQLAHDLQDRIPPADVRLGQQPARGVHRQLAAELDAPVLHPRRRFALAAETEALEHEQHQRRKRIIGVETRNILAPDSRHAVGKKVALLGFPAPGPLLIDAKAARREDELFAPGAHPLHAGAIDRRLLQAPGALGTS